jgi:hypothetical protein
VSVVYRYDNPDGSCAFYHVRIQKREGKTFYYAHPAPVRESGETLTDPHSGLVVSVARRMRPEACGLVYRLPELLSAIRDGEPETWCCEGEHDSETLRGLDLVATTSWTGAGHWGPPQAEWFRGYEGVVCVVVDNDAPGAAEGVLKHDTLSALGVRVELYRPPGFKDVSDMVDAGIEIGGLEEVDRDELAELGAGWLVPGRKREWMGYGVDVTFLTRVLEGIS